MTRDDIQALAGLCRLHFTDTELDTVAEEFSSIVEYVGTISAIDGNAPLGTPPGHLQACETRADVAGECLTAGEALHNAPSRNEAFFKVPRVLG